MKKIINILLTTGILITLITPSPGSAVSAVVDEGEITLHSSDSYGLSFTLNVPADRVIQELLSTNSGDYTQILLPGWPTSGDPGAPQLPFFTQAIGAPFGASIDLHVSPGKAHTIKLDAPILPQSREVVTWEDPELNDGLPIPKEITTIYEQDPSVYRADVPYPGQFAEVVNDGTLRKQRLVSIGVYPFQWAPNLNELTIYEDIYVEVSFSGASSQLQRSYEPDSSIYESIFQSSLLNYDVAKSWRGLNSSLERGIAEQRSLHWSLPDPAWKISIQEDGFYHLTAGQLVDAGVPIDSLNPDTLQLFHLGEEVAIIVNPDKSILFYGQSIDNKYTKDNIYWLTYGKTSGLRIGARDGTLEGSSPVPSSFVNTYHIEKNTYYVSSGAPGEYEHFFSEWVSPDRNWDLSFTLQNRQSEIVHLRVLLMGITQDISVNPDHHAVLFINGVQIEDNIRWDGVNFHLAEVDIPQGVLVAGENTLTIQEHADNGITIDTFYIDWVEFNYDRSFEIVGDELAFNFHQAGTWQYKLEGFTSGDAEIYDISNPHQPVQIQNFDIQEVGPAFTVSFEDEIIGTVHYWSGTPATFRSIEGITLDKPSNLSAISNRADYLIISHADFLEQAEVLRQYRQGSGLDTVLVDIQDIYDEFGYGITDVLALQNFLAYTLESWAEPAPSYVLLVGDGHYDPKNYLNWGKPSFILPFLANVDPNIGETAADNRYVSLSTESTLPNMLLGRLAVNTPEEAAAFIAKIIAYETNPPLGDWQHHLLAVTDYDSSPSSNYAAMLNAILNQLYPAQPYSLEKMYWKKNHSDLDQATATIKDGFNQGSLFVNYFGHGYYGGWGKNPVFFKTDHINSLAPDNEKLSILLSFTCQDGYYIWPHQLTTRDSLAEVITRTPGKGAAASWSPTGWGTNRGHERLNYGFLESVFVHGSPKLGTAIQNSLLTLWNSGRDLDQIDTYLLFGDPAMRIALSLTAVNDHYSILEDTELIVPVETGVLNNDTNPNKAALTTSLAANVQYGTLDLSSDGSFNYTPNDGFYGVDSFTYSISDGTKTSNIATVTLEVISKNRPIAHDQDLSTRMEVPINITLTADSSNMLLRSSNNLFNNPDDTEFTFTIVDEPIYGLLSGEQGSPERVYTPTGNYIGTDSFTFIANDGSLDSNLAKVTIEIIPKENATITGFGIFLPLFISGPNK